MNPSTSPSSAGGLRDSWQPRGPRRWGSRRRYSTLASPNTPGGLGGFAPFSGAKFSLFPAGSGLVPLVGSEEALISRYARTCREFAELGFPEFELTAGELAGEESDVRPGLAYRNYHSVLLSPDRMAQLLTALSSRLQRTTVARTGVAQLGVLSGPPFGIKLASGERTRSRRLLIAAGRLGAKLLKDAGLEESGGKGIDVGVRLGFASREPLRGLRELGPDAKFLADGVRTFCLNSPGRIFHYPGAGFLLPGGVVAEPQATEANVGILVRLSNRQAVLDRLEAVAPRGKVAPLSFQGEASGLRWTSHARSVLGSEVCERIDEFMAKLSASGLVELPTSFVVHYPLLDWHWPVFSAPGRLATAAPGVIASGDASGHARGLLQAAVTGAMAVEEALN